MSAILLSLPAMLRGMRDDVCLILCQMAKNRSSRPAATEVDVLPLKVHATADVLS